MPEIKQGKLLTEGKTKRIFEVEGVPSVVIIENKDDITAFDNPEFTKKFGTKAMHATTTTCRVFELLQEAGIPVAYYEQISPVRFTAPACKMIPLETVARRYAVGSYIKRRPDCEATPPMRFHRLVTEYFLKTTGGELVVDREHLVDGKLVRERNHLVGGLDPKAGEEDPLIDNFFGMESIWKLKHPKKPSWVPTANLKRHLGPPQWAAVCHPEHRQEIDKLLRSVFLVLEGAFTHQFSLRFIDLKIEFGVNKQGELLVADVIDNDSWRLRDKDWNELSKEFFRQGGALDQVEDKYAQVAGLVSQFRVPKQIIVFWTGSAKDQLGEAAGKILRESPYLNVEFTQITASGHKSPAVMIRKLEETMRAFPDGGVIIAEVGMSNGLAPTLAARTSWPVIAVPASFDKFPEDVWSSLRVPSSVPLATVLSEANAIDLALNILAQSNPLAYAYRQQKIEELDE